jgi:hypothetical protein
MTKEYGLGQIFDTSGAKTPQILSTFFNDKDWKVDEGGVRRLLEHHTVESFSQHLTYSYCQKHNIKQVHLPA